MTKCECERSKSNCNRFPVNIWDVWFQPRLQTFTLPLINLRNETFLVLSLSYCNVVTGKHLLLILYHVHVFIRLRHVIRREVLSAHRSAHWSARGETEIRWRVARVRHVVARLVLVAEVVHLGTVVGVVVVVRVLVVLIVPEVVGLVVWNIRERIVRVRRCVWRWWRRHDRWVGAQRRKVTAGLSESWIDVKIWLVVNWDAKITVFETVVARRGAWTRLDVHRSVAHRLIAEAARAVVVMIQVLLLTNHIDRWTHRGRWRDGQYWWWVVVVVCRAQST